MGEYRPSGRRPASLKSGFGGLSWLSWKQRAHRYKASDVPGLRPRPESRRKIVADFPNSFLDSSPCRRPRHASCFCSAAQHATREAYAMMERQILSCAEVMFLAFAAVACGGPTPPAPSDASRVAAQQATLTTVSQDTVSQDTVSQDSRVHRLWAERGNAAETNFCLGPGDLVEVSVA